MPASAWSAPSGSNSKIDAERLLLPLSKDGITCDKLLTAIYFTNSSL